MENNQVLGKKMKQFFLNYEGLKAPNSLLGKEKKKKKIMICLNIT